MSSSPHTKYCFLNHVTASRCFPPDKATPPYSASQKVVLRSPRDQNTLSHRASHLGTIRRGTQACNRAYSAHRLSIPSTAFAVGTCADFGVWPHFGVHLGATSTRSPRPVAYYPSCHPQTAPNAPAAHPPPPEAAPPSPSGLAPSPIATPHGPSGPSTPTAAPESRRPTVRPSPSPLSPMAGRASPAARAVQVVVQRQAASACNESWRTPASPAGASARR